MAHDLPFLKRLTCVAIVMAICLLLLCPDTGARAQSAFYSAPASDVAGAEGTLVRQEPMTGAPLGASAYRVLYRSRDPNGKPILVSGVIVVPQGPPPPGGRPIIAWAHPTTGIVPRCAPSLAIFIFQQIQGLRPFVERGYVVAATDYPGLGTPGPHPYLVGISEARAVIDSVRVARQNSRISPRISSDVPLGGRTTRSSIRMVGPAVSIPFHPGSNSGTRKWEASTTNRVGRIYGHMPIRGHVGTSEKCEAAFRKDHAQTTFQSAMAIQLNPIAL